MQNASLWRGVLGIEKTVVEDVEFDDDEQVLVAHVRPRQHAARRCGRCGRRCRGYDQGEGRRRWRGLDLGTIPVWLESDAPRVDCPEHGVVWRRCRGPGTARVTPSSSMSRLPGWRPSARGLRSPR